MQNSISVVVLGATGAVGSQAVKTLCTFKNLNKLTLLGRRPLKLTEDFVVQHEADIFKPGSYSKYLSGHTVAICTLGVGQPSKMSKEDFIKIDKQAVLDFAEACKDAGIEHFQLLGSVGASSESFSFYLRSKGELVDELKKLNFKRLSIFQPSMILTPENRYGFLQGLTLKVWPILKPVLFGKLQRYRGIAVDKLGAAIALNTLREGNGVEVLEWSDFIDIAKQS